MRIDVVSIFPDFFAPLSLSLAGKAVSSGLLDVQVHDLRDFTHDRHRTVDDTPYGGGAGMVMRPEPWGEALDSVLGSGPPADAASAVLVVPTPSGHPFTQATAERLSHQERLVFACGRYEGIDQRVVDHYRDSGSVYVEELSIGDYVVNGGEVAALVMIEAIVRLLPGFMGNPESLSEESHGDEGLLEYPVYTKPPVWRDLEVPDVLLSGDHGRIAAWRHDQSLRRTVERRPDLAHPSRIESELETGHALPAELGQIRTVEAAVGLPAGPEEGLRVVVRAGGRVVASAVLAEGEETDLLSHVAVVPDLSAATGLERLAAYAVGRGRPVEVDAGSIESSAVKSALRPLGFAPYGGRWRQRH